MNQKEKKQDVKLDMERIYIEHPEFYGKEMIERHVKRYDWTLSKLNADDDVLELCCGSGYGSKMIAEKCKKVLALDKSKDAIAYAKQHYKKDNLQYEPEDLSNPNFWKYALNLKFNAIVWIEAIEHFTDLQAVVMLQVLSKMLLPGGRIIISTPDKENSESKNEFHVKEYTAFELKNLIRRYFNIDEIKVENNFIYIVAR